MRSVILLSLLLLGCAGLARADTSTGTLTAVDTVAYNGYPVMTDGYNLYIDSGTGFMKIEPAKPKPVTIEWECWKWDERQYLFGLQCLREIGFVSDHTVIWRVPEGKK